MVLFDLFFISGGLFTQPLDGLRHTDKRENPDWRLSILTKS